MYAKATVLGNLGRDPETRYTQGGRMNVSFSIASSRRYTDASGNQQEKTTWFRVTAWGKLAEIADKLAQDGYLKKGRTVLVSGRLETSEYTGQDGEKRFSLDLTADDLVLAGNRGDGQSSGGTGQFRSGEPAPIAEDIDDLPF
jgi:single-strand DNA-binding protein